MIHAKGGRTTNAGSGQKTRSRRYDNMRKAMFESCLRSRLLCLSIYEFGQLLQAARPERRALIGIQNVADRRDPPTLR